MTSAHKFTRPINCSFGGGGLVAEFSAMAMEKKLTLLQTVIAAGVFSSVSFWCQMPPPPVNFGTSWGFEQFRIIFSTGMIGFLFSCLLSLIRYGFMFGRESARKELAGLIDDLRRSNVAPSEAASEGSHQ